MRTVVVFVSEVAQLTQVLSRYEEMPRLAELAVCVGVLRLVHVRAADAAAEHRALLVPGKALAFVDAIHDRGRPDDCRFLAARRRAWNAVLEVDDRERLVSIAVYPVASDVRDVLSATVETCLQSHVRLVGADSTALAAFGVAVGLGLVSHAAYALENTHAVLVVRPVGFQRRMDVVCAIAAFQSDCLHEGVERDGGVRTPVAAGGVACWLVAADAADIARLVSGVCLEVPRYAHSAFDGSRQRLRPSGDALAVGERLPPRKHGGPVRGTRLTLCGSPGVLKRADDALGACVGVSRRRERGLVEARLAGVARAWGVCARPRAGGVDPRSETRV
jgi:hypothetical protein